MNRLLWIWVLLIFNWVGLKAQPKTNIPLVVDARGKGSFKSIQAAINSLPDSAANDRIILIKNGIYNEKIFITKNHLVLRGESEKGVMITQDIARDIWRCQGNTDDWGVATLNLRGSDITLQNLSVINGYGFHHRKDTTVNCQIGSGPSSSKTVSITGHQMALRSFQTTRLRVLNCTFRALGGDTVSPWNSASGLFYFKDCTLEGGVDFYCPRGWAYAENCVFICHNKEAAIWHDGSGNINQKSVLVNCKFDGDQGFKLGRYHRESQFYLVNCTFGSNMADAPIYRAASSTGVEWGERVYYYNCHRNGGDYAWFANNLNNAKGMPIAKDITALWALDRQWNPLLN
jgi:pectinesterase